MSDSSAVLTGVKGSAFDEQQLREDARTLVESVAVGADQLEEQAERRWRAHLRFLRERPAFVLAVVTLLLALAWAVAPSLFTSWDPIDGVPRDRLSPPGDGHLFGTDQLGRDLYARIVYGAGQSLAATAGAVGVGLVLGSGLGLLAGSARGWVDDVIMRIVDVLLSIPSLLLSLALITALGFGTINVAIAVGLASVASFARIMRSEVLRVGGAEYVEAARVSGVSWWGVLIRHILPNSAGPVIALSALEFGQAVLAISALSFLGFGAPPPAPEWGALVSGGRDYLATAWWLITFPGLVIAAVVLAANQVARTFERPER
ncbi:ABC transporter permease [Pseudoclavibacter soli]|uniref:ABC transporter permease n=1 Tax=Pseudoclavibacter soli TaxID=452623 RepID=UPI0003FC64B0|nr:ABC transporter permease [Pseudoclavibacter soli]